MNTRVLHSRPRTLQHQRQAPQRRGRCHQMLWNSEDPDHQCCQLLDLARPLAGEMNRCVEACNQRVLIPEQTLDEYCYEFLDNKELNKRDADQVVCRYTKNIKKKSCHQCRDGRQGSQGTSSCQRCHDTTTSEDADEILVVSQLWIWVLGGSLRFSCPSRSTEPQNYWQF